ncbi:MAG: NAD-dependent epimerase/dehydratase family protein [Solirubrobacterales bacterium]
MKALVTGGAGFIGSNLVDALIARGDEVEVIDDLSTGRRENLDQAVDAGAVLHVEDIATSDRIPEIVGAFGPNVVFHLAAQMDVRRSVADPAFDASVNVVGTVRMLSAAADADCPRFVFASTGGAIYGEGADRPLPFAEDAEILPIAPYGQSKAAAEGYVTQFTRTGRLEGTSLRFGNVYGPRQDPKGEAGVIAIVLGRALDGQALAVFGSGEQTRDYVFVGDVVAAFLAASENPPGTFNIATGEETSVNRLVEMIDELFDDREVEVVHEEARDGEVESIYLDASLAGSGLGWSPGTTLADGLARTVESLRTPG